jgi:hypothetical protein
VASDLFDWRVLLSEQPLLRASLLLFGAIGITAGEYLTVFN